MALLRLLERFPGYTLSTLREESSELMQLIAIDMMGNPQPEGGGLDV